MNKTIVAILTAFIPNKKSKEAWKHKLTKIDLGSMVNKGIAELIAGLIPHKMTRNQWRGILRYGVFKGLRLRYFLKKHKLSTENFDTIILIENNQVFIKSEAVFKIAKYLPNF